MRKSSKRLILIELNEINFDVVERYVSAAPNEYGNFRKLLKLCRIRTTSESEYEHLEPWIQWVSVHTGKTFAEHGVFRLGDVVGTAPLQVFEQVEQAGYKVGSISAMNAENRLNEPAYFIPDPWTQTPSDRSFWSIALWNAVSQAVNDNAQSRITVVSALQLSLAFLRFAKARHFKEYFSILTASRNRPWLKAMFLDLFLHDVHLTKFESTRADFSTLFLNAGAHIQHHYFFNAMPLKDEDGPKNPPWYVQEEEDPLADLLKLYDLIVGEYLERSDFEVILATGLTQKPYDRVKYYYRLKAHENFLKRLGIAFLRIIPRMTRDFLVEFATEGQAIAAQEMLESISVGKERVSLFGDIDNRGKSLFVTLTYPDEIDDTTFYSFQGEVHLLRPHVSFVAIKNGMHQSHGFAFFTPEVARFAPADGAHVSELASVIRRNFGLS